EAACQEAKELLGDIETASVKQGLGRNSAISLSASAAADKIRVGINTALKKHLTKPVKPFVLDGPFVLEKRFLSTDSVDAISADPRYKRIDSQTVQITSNNILDVIYA
ncbi:MAG: M55 family metallopeptidase, partial [Victivallaceae bacterium]|nr:M55 family metallopeptidase [Victivallaceae bacterium]